MICWACDSFEVIRCGKLAGNQRFKCKDCGIFFTQNSIEQTLKNRFVWFKKWVLGRQTFKVSGEKADCCQETRFRKHCTTFWWNLHGLKSESGTRLTFGWMPPISKDFVCLVTRIISTVISS